MLFCLVPSPEFSHAPWDSHPVHLCRFAVRLRVAWSLEAFPGSMASATSLPEGSSSSRLRIDTAPDLPGAAPYTLEPGHPTPGSPSLLRPPIAATRSTGILTCFPSTTPFGLALGTDSPCAEKRCAGTLGLSASRFFTCFIVTHVSIHTSDTSSRPPGPPSTAYGTLPYRALRRPQLRHMT